MDVGPKAPRVSNIRVDYAHGIRQAVQHLAAMKHEQIGFVTGPLKLRSAVARKDAFEDSMREIGLPTATYLRANPVRSAPGHQATRGRWRRRS